MEIIGAESEFVGEIARTAEKRNFEKLSIPIQRRVLQIRLNEIGIAADFGLIESLRQSANQFVSIGANVSVARNELGEIKMWKQKLKPEFSANELMVYLSGRAGDVHFDGVKFNWSFDNGSRRRSPHQKQIEFFDADKIGGKIILRHWRAGDRFHPIGLKLAAKLQDLFTNAKILRERRRNLIVAEVSGGEIFWVEGLRISENFKITLRTKRQLIWCWKNRG